MASTACQKLAPIPRNITLDCPPQRRGCHSLDHPHTFFLYPSPTIRPMFHGTRLHFPISKTAMSEQAMLANPLHLRADPIGSTCILGTEQVVASTENSEDSSSMSSRFTFSNSDVEDEDATSSSSTSSFSSAATQVDDAADIEEPLDSLASLAAALPMKRGLSRFFSGKSQSFSCLARVSSVGDLAKPENPYVKRQRILAKHTPSTGPIRKRPTNNTVHPFKCLPLLEEDKSATQGAHGKPNPQMWPSKCLSAPELQKT